MFLRQTGPPRGGATCPNLKGVPDFGVNLKLSEAPYVVCVRTHLQVAIRLSTLCLTEI